MKVVLFIPLLLASTLLFGQRTYEDSVQAFLANYVQTHEVVKGEDKKAMQFYPVNKSLRVVADVEKAEGSKWINFPTSGKAKQVFRLYGTLAFTLNSKPIRLKVYQAQNLLLNPGYRDYLFLPFTDSTTGNETYEGGRYIDLSTKDIRNGAVVLDFNKAYNPYCAYVSGQYNCPIPPKENALPVAIMAGEKVYGKSH